MRRKKRKRRSKEKQTMEGREGREPKWRALKSKITRRKSFNTIPELTRAEDP
jgi:hypothetical protein